MSLMSREHTKKEKTWKNGSGKVSAKYYMYYFFNINFILVF